MSEYRKELEKYLTMPNAHINCAENTSMALTDALGIGGGLEDARRVRVVAVECGRLLERRIGRALGQAERGRRMRSTHRRRERPGPVHGEPSARGEHPHRRQLP